MDVIGITPAIDGTIRVTAVQVVVIENDREDSEAHLIVADDPSKWRRHSSHLDRPISALLLQILIPRFTSSFRSDRDRSGRRGGGGGFRSDSFRRDGRGPPRGDRPERRDRSRDVTENMEIESDKVKYVIGRGGTKIRDIQYQCRVSVQIDKSPNESGYNNVQISGAPGSIKRAKDAINDVVRRVIDFEDKERDRNSRSRERDRRRKYSDSD